MVNKQRGFTLVEIAIVLVIIGLLLGGILKGQELVTAARVRNFADQAAGVQAAYYGFIDRYRAVPGDMLAADACAAIGGEACPGTGGNGNGRIDPADPAPWVEAAAAWDHMAAAGFLQGRYAGTATAATYITAAPIPAAPTNPWNGFLLLGRTDDYMVPPASPPPTPPRLHLITGRNVPVNIMRELDVKVDDSSPESGILRSAPAVAAGFPTVGGSDAACVLAGIWNIAANPTDCNGYYLY
jgi:prepilin-type N-terminal cleavage/methylation domain-containing protein